MKSCNDTWLGEEEVANFFEGREAFKWQLISTLFNTNLWYSHHHVLQSIHFRQNGKKLQFVLYAATELFSMQEAIACISLLCL
jgi:hypothetical protein